MNIWLIIPVKPLEESKSRLDHILTVEQRRELITSLLSRTIKISQEIKGIQRITVISTDNEVHEIAQLNGAAALLETGTLGLNAALSQARDFTAQGTDNLLILPADLPFINTSDLNRFLDPLINSAAKRLGENTDQQSRLMVICPDQHGTGTNALLLHPAEHFDFHFGPDSFQQHLREANRTQRISHIIDPPGLRFDLDNGEDWTRYQELKNDIVLSGFSD